MRNHVFLALLSFFFIQIMLPQTYASAGQTRSSPGRWMLVGALRMPDEKFLKFIERVQPDVVIMGAFGPPQWAQQKDPRKWLDQWRTIFARLHRRRVKVIGMIELLNVGNSPKEAKKWAEFYEKRWDDKLLGKRPTVSAASLLEQRKLPPDKQTGAHAPRGCANNPHWRAVEKALVKALIDAGIDGFITHRNMYGECRCKYCLDPGTKRGLKLWLSEHFTPKQLQMRFGIKDIKTHRFDAIYSHHRDHRMLPNAVQLEGMKFARHSIREAFEDVFIKHGRSLKRDLIVAQWNHMPYFDELHLDRGHIPPWHLTTFAHASADERWSLPPSLWGKNEDFFWYCNWGTCQNTQLDKRFVADVTLYAKLLRSQAGGRAYVVNKYDFYRPRQMMAEAAALGMMAGAIRVPYESKEDADVMSRYFAFFRRHADIYRNNNGQTVADVLLVYPRMRTHLGDADGLEMVELAGRTMIVNHIQFDHVPDDLLAKTKLGKYRAVIVSDLRGLNHKQFAEYVQNAGKVIVTPRGAVKGKTAEWKDVRPIIVQGLQPHTGGTAKAQLFRRALAAALGDKHAVFKAPYTVETHVYRQPNRLIAHFVNYNHKEKAPGKSVVEREAPMAALPVDARLPLPAGAKVTGVLFLDPDSDKSISLKHEQRNGYVSFQSPGFLTYGVAVVEMNPK